MKKTILLFWLLAGVMPALWAQSQKENIKMTAAFRETGASQVLCVENIHGDVLVEAYSGNQVLLEAEKIISATGQAQVSKGMQEVQLKMTETGDSILVYLEAPFIQRKKDKDRHVQINQKNSGYQYRVNITLKVPAKVKLLVSAVNDGEVRVSQLKGDILARHVNGPITLTGVSGRTEVTTVNGAINVTWATDSPPAASFRTVNGNVKAQFPGRLNGNLVFKSLNGELFTDLPNLALQPAKVTRNTDRQGGRTIYRVDKSQSYQVGKGGAALSFETLNGNVYLRKK